MNALCPCRPRNREEDCGWTIIDAAGSQRRDEFENAVARWSYRIIASSSPGDRIAIVIPPSSEFCAVLIAVARSGRVAVPLSPQMPEAALDRIFSDCEPALVIDESLAQMGGDVPPPGVEAPGDCAGEDAFMIVYTSGSTGAPKGVVMTHANVAFASAAILASLQYSPRDIVFNTLPLHYTYGMYQLFLSVLSRATLFIGGGSLKIGDLGLAAASRATVLPVTPASAPILVRAAGRWDLSCIRLITVAAAHLSAHQRSSLRVSFPEAAIIVMYGMTECARISIMNPEAEDAHPGSVGRPIAGTSVSVQNGDRLCAPGVEGEIVATGPHLGAYWSGAEERGFNRRADGTWELRSGDLGWMDEDGYLYVTGRLDDVFKMNGVRTSSAEIEDAASSISGVESVVVLGPIDGRASTLFYTGSIAESELRLRIIEILGVVKTPGAIVRRDSLPLAGNGKFDRARLRLVSGFGRGDEAEV
jgi:acyl-CoA synthetase (AMP-forming)/AMP-acid ligase II